MLFVFFFNTVKEGKIWSSKITVTKLEMQETGDTVQHMIAAFGIRVDKGEFNIRAHLDALRNNVHREMYIHTGKYILFYNNKEELSRGYIDSMSTDQSPKKL